MRRFLTIFFMIAFYQAVAQDMTIAGHVFDTTSNLPTRNAVAMAVRVRDSTLLAFTRTDSSGHFHLKIKTDTVQVIISTARTNDQAYYVFGSSTNNAFDFGRIILPPKSQELKEVIIYAFKDPVYYKGDTLVYTADSFKVKPNATVEDLLRKLPGMKVDANGKITSQGKEISQVLVDGDEFFGTDPTVATRNLAANGVESVNVYEKKNENATEGGDETIQVMDLKMKEDAKKGYFGKLSGGTDGQKFYEGDILANKFKGSQKVSVFALGSNTPRAGFGWGDMFKYGLDNEMNISTDEESGDVTYYSDNSGPKGIPRTFKSGFYYNDKLAKNTKLNLNYTYNNNQLNSSGSTHSQYFLKDTSYTTDDSTRNERLSETHSINMKLSQKIDSLTDLEIEPHLKINNGQQNSFKLTRFITSEDTLSRATDVTNDNKASGYDLDATARLSRKFRKKDRFLKVTYQLLMTNNSSIGVLKSNSTWYNNSLIANDSINQQKKSSSDNIAHNASVNYTEPLTKKVRMEFSYDFNYGVNKQSKTARDYYNGDYSISDPLHTNDFENTRITNRLGTKLIFEVKKYSVFIGVRLRNVSIENRNLITATKIGQSVNSVLPLFSYMYKFGETARFNFRYTTNSSQPTIDQLQPVPDNTNPNQVKVGNPDLLPTFVQNFNATYNVFKPISGKYLWTNVSFTETNRAFGNSISYDSLGVAHSKTVNVSGNNNGYFYMGGGLPLFSRKLELDPNISANFSNFTGYINGQRNTTATSSLGGGLSLNLKLDTIEFSLSGNIEYDKSSSSLNLQSIKPYTMQNYSASVRWRFPLKIDFETSADYYINGQRAAGYNLSYLTWNASISKSFFKNENLIVMISGNDLLNQNINTQRNVQDNVITDSKTNIISRYFLFKVTYKFNSTNTKDDEGYY